MPSGEKIADLYADLRVETAGFDASMTTVKGKFVETGTHIDNSTMKARAFAGALNTVGTQGVRIDNVGMAISNLGQAMNLAKLGAVGLGLEIGTSMGNALYKIPAVQQAVDGVTQSFYDWLNPLEQVDQQMINAGNRARTMNRERWDADKKAKKQAEEDKKYRIEVMSLDDAKTKAAIQLGNIEQKINLYQMERSKIAAQVSKDRFEEIDKAKKLVEVDTQLALLGRAKAEEDKKSQNDLISLQEDLADKRFQLAMQDEQAAINQAKKTSISFTSGGIASWKQAMQSQLSADSDERQARLDQKRAVKQREDMVKAIEKVEAAIRATKEESAVVTA